MLYGDYEHVLAKERMESAIREREQDRLVKQLRSASRSPRGGLIARSVALITSLFRLSERWPARPAPAVGDGGPDR
jgi:hypothetical protein